MPPKAAKQKAVERTPAPSQSEPRRAPSRVKITLIPAAVIFIFSFLLYANTLRGDFVWDDRELIVENRSVQSLDGATLKQLFLDNFWQSKDRLGGYYRPLVALSYHFNYKLFGMKPAGFHLCNIITNALACVLAFLFVQLLFGNTVLAFLTALLFAALPLHTENVAWISGRTDIFATAWMLVSLLLFVLAGRGDSLILLFASLGAAVAAFLSKETAVALPFLVLAVDRIRRGSAGTGGGTPGETRPRPRRARLWWAPYAYALLLVAYLLVRASVIGSASSTYTHTAESTAGRIALAFSILAGYAFKLVYPFNLNAEYDAPVPEGFADPHVLAGILLAAGLIYTALRCRRRYVCLMSIALFLLGVAPVLNLVPLGEISAERFLYLPSLGFALALGALFAAALGGRSSFAPSPGGRHANRSGTGAPGRHKTPAVILFLALLAAYGARTAARTADWRNENVLFTKTVSASGGSARAHLNLGNAHRRSGRAQDAIAEYRKAMAILPEYLEAMSNLAGMYRQLGKIEEADGLLRRAIAKYPENAELRSNLGTILVAQKRYDEGKKELELAVGYDPSNLRARFNLGVVHAMTNEPDKALALFEEVKDKGNEFEMAYYHIGTIEAARGNLQYAKQQLERFLQIHRTNDQFRSRAEELLREAGRPAAVPGR